MRLEALPDASLPKGGTGRSPGDGNFVLSGLSITLKTKDGHARELPLARAEADFAQDGYPVEHVLKNPDIKKHGWAVAPRQAEAHRAVFILSQPAIVGAGAHLVVRLDHQFEFAYPGFSMGRFRIATTGDRDPRLAAALPKDVAQILTIPAQRRTKEQSAKLLRHYLDSTSEVKSNAPSRPGCGPRLTPSLPLRGRRSTANCRPARGESPGFHRRGNFLDQGDRVEPATPSFFAPLPKDAPRNRLGVARWLLAPENPLTARVAVNRHWAQFFGRGLVETQEDFGAQGQPPSHPELLDWLACEFRDGGWSMKRLCRLIVTSATYRQSSRRHSRADSQGPRQPAAGAGPRFRLEAEMIRDSALQTAGLLEHQDARPLGHAASARGNLCSTYSTDRWIVSPGEDRYRRGLYTFVKRTSPYPALTTFDAPSREVCTIRRISTNTPLQALVTLNDPAFVEAAQALARRLTRQGSSSVSECVGQGLRLALIRRAGTARGRRPGGSISTSADLLPRSSRGGRQARDRAAGAAAQGCDCRRSCRA